MPPIKKLKQERDDMITNGTLNIGEPVAPYALTHFKVTNTGKPDIYKSNLCSYDIALLR